MATTDDTRAARQSSAGFAASEGERPPAPAAVRPRQRRRDIVVAASCGVFVAAMVGVAFAAVPLYNWFCRTTGFGGIPQVAAAAPQRTLDRTVTVRFDANIGRGLPWRFEPETTSLDVRLGEVVTVYYTVTNASARDTAAQASYNVAPPQIGGYFTKINCFCFTEQRLRPGEKRELAVVFYVDPELAKDADQNDLNTITLSYTFYPLREAPPVTNSERPDEPKRS